MQLQETCIHAVLRKSCQVIFHLNLIFILATMSDGAEETFNAVELDGGQAKSSNVDMKAQHTVEASKPLPQAEERTAPSIPSAPDVPKSQEKANRWVNAVDQFKVKRFFVLRPGTLDHAIDDIKALVNQEEDGPINNIWLMAEVDHWNNEKERLVVLTENTLLICKYDFVMFNCEQVQRVPLHYVDRIIHGSFCFPQHSLLKREGEGMRIFWDRLREPAFSSRWNPFTMDYPYCTFTYHPVRSISDRFSTLCDLETFREQLAATAERALERKPLAGRANGVLTLNQPILIEAYVGLMSFISNQNKLGYCLARGNIGF
ncbi:tumor protein p63-regulated gene 1 protein isoform X1 [Alosa sapidissima]|nr:tumor protein p63-regulated gene 1 protein isoform X1 [Alosa sapidissima]